MDRSRTLSAAGRCRRIGPAGAALLLILLAGACAAPSVAPPQPEDQPPAPETEAETREDEARALPADDAAAAAPAEDAAEAEAVPEAPPALARVGLLLPLSGRYASEGETLLRAAQLALFDVADEHFLLLPRDTEGTATGAERAALALLEEGVDLILGPLFSEGVSAVASHARARNVTVVAFSTDRAAASEGVYLLGHTPRAQIRRVFAHAAAKGHREIALLVPDTRYGAAVLVEAWAAAEAAGLSPTRVRTYAPDASDAAEVVRALAEYDRRAQALKDERAALARQNDAAARQRLGRLATLDTLGALPFDALLLADGGARLRQVAPLLPYYDIDPRRSACWARASGRTRPRSASQRLPEAGSPGPIRRRDGTSRAATAGSSARRPAPSPPSPTTRQRWRPRSRAPAPRSSPRPSAIAGAFSAPTGCSASTRRGSRNGASRSSRWRAAARPVS